MLSSMIVVVADDDKEDDFRLTDIALRNFHPVLQSARNLKIARQQMKAPGVSVMLLDRRIPMDGVSEMDCTIDEWCDFIEEAKMYCAVMIYTSHPSSDDQDRAKNAGAIDYLTKSHCQFFPEQFATRIKDASEFYLKNKTVLDSLGKVEQLGRDNRAALEAFREEVRIRLSASSSKETYKAGKRAGIEQQKRIQKAAKIGREVGAWGFLVTLPFTVYHASIWVFHWGQVFIAFFKAARK